MRSRTTHLDPTPRLWAAVALLALALNAGVSAQTVATLAGGRLDVQGPDYGFLDGNSLKAAQFNGPLGLAVNPATHDLLVADATNGAIRRLDLSGGQTVTIITNLNLPVAVLFDSTNNFYVLNQGDGTLLRYDPFDNLYRFPTTLVGGLSQPTAMALDATTNLYLTELGGTVKRINLSTRAVTNIAAGLNQPRGIAVLDSGLVAVSDTASNTIRFLDPATGIFVNRVGNGIAGYRDQKDAKLVEFNQPYQLAKAPNSTLVVADRLNHRVRLIGLDGTVTTLYGVDTNIWEGPCLSCVPILLPGWFDGPAGNRPGDAEAREPAGVTVAADGTVYVSEDFYHLIRSVTGTGLNIGGAGPGGGSTTNLVVLPPTVTIPVAPNPSLLAGYYPMGVDLQVLNLNTNFLLSSLVLYTTDGSDPSTNNLASQTVVFTNNTGVIHWRETLHDLSSLRVKAFLGSQPSTVVSGQMVTNNQAGFATDLTAGIGSTVMVPLVANLSSNTTLKSIQFLVTLTPLGTAAPWAAPVRTVPITSDDFVPLVFGSTNVPFTQTFSNGTAIQLSMSYLGQSGFSVANGFATVSLLAVPIPPGAKLGDQYQLAVSAPDGTSDGQQTRVAMTSLPARTITVVSAGYLVGDSSPSSWYNAGGFGDGSLNNADVNNAFSASLGVRLPPAFTDAFDAMDAFPEDTSAAVGGDGKIRFLDWQTILDRALNLHTNNWRRTWAAGGVRVATRAPAGGSTFMPAPVLSADGNGRLEIAPLQADAELAVASVGNIPPGVTVAVPLTLDVLNGSGVAGLQFLASVEPEAGAPALSQPVTFTEDLSTSPQPAIRAAGLPSNQAGVAWSLMAGAFSPPLAGRGVALGWVRFTIPTNARQGQSYAVRLLSADGAPDLHTQYEFGLQSGRVTVLAAAPPSPATRAFKLTWPGAAGYLYRVESTSSLSSSGWTTEAEGLLGRGSLLDFIDRGATTGVKFYRVLQHQ